MNDNSKQLAEIPEKANFSSGGAVLSLVPQSLDEAFRLSQALAGSGDMVPSNFQGEPNAIMAAILRGAEIGLAPMQALSNIAVINGRSCLWGDALPALMQRANHDIHVEISGEGDATVATATLTRGDNGKVTVRTFSVDDAKKAKLWGKAGPWQTYPKRMLTHRARGWAIRDGAADALMGMQVAEEVSDYQPVRDVTPKAATGFAARALQARQAKQQPPEPNEGDDATTIDAKANDVSNLPAESLPEQSGNHGAEAARGDAASSATENDEAPSETFREGLMACLAGEGRDACPSAFSSPEKAEWLAGYDSAEGPIQHTTEEDQNQ